MKKNDLQISIPTPCHENWDAMTPTEIGKFCSLCQKEVIDFSRMSDQEIRRILNSSKETPCGRFNQNQLERPLVAELPVNRSLTWIKYAASLLLAFQGSNAISQTTNTTISPKDDVKISKDSIEKIQFRCGRYIRPKEEMKTPKNSIESMEISGFILDSIEVNESKETFISGHVLDSITEVEVYDVKVKLIFQNNVIAIARTDFNGHFRMNIKNYTNSIENYSLIFSQNLEGYKEIQISLSDCLKLNNGTNSDLKKEIEIFTLGGIVVKPKKKWYQFWKK